MSAFIEALSFPTAGRRTAKLALGSPVGLWGRRAKAPPFTARRSQLTAFTFATLRATKGWSTGTLLRAGTTIRTGHGMTRTRIHVWTPPTTLGRGTTSA